MRRIEVVPHDPKWQNLFEAEAQKVTVALSKNVVSIHHIGSTSIPNIYAKPIIDLLVEVKKIGLVDEQTAPMELLGYEAMGEFGIAGRRYFRKDNQASVRTHHVHVFTAASDEVKRHLAFRDYMIAHPEGAQEYSELKRKLARQHPTNIDRYMDGKDGFIKAIDKKAQKWEALTVTMRSQRS